MFDINLVVIGFRNEIRLYLLYVSTIKTDDILRFLRQYKEIYYPYNALKILIEKCLKSRLYLRCINYFSPFNINYTLN